MTVKCTNINNPHAAFRWENGKLRLYPNPEIAESWNWKEYGVKVVDCTNLPFGDVMTLKCPEGYVANNESDRCVVSLEEGDAVKCNPDNITVYRYTDGKLRSYPNPSIASSWDANWGTNVRNFNCDGIPKGNPMPYKVS